MNIKLLASITLALSLVGSSVAAPFSYAQSSVSIKAGILRVGPNPTPHVFGNLDLDRLVKPASWKFENPVANSIVTDTVKANWVADPTAQLGGRLTKSHAGYWELSLPSSSDEVLSRFDVLLLPINGTLSLGPVEREKLRKFVDQGGLLWIDLVGLGSGIHSIHSGPLPFRSEFSQGFLYSDFQHRLLTFPNSITSEEIQYAFGASGNSIAPVGASNIPLAPVLNSIEPDSNRWRSVIGIGPNAVAGLGQIGDGYMLLTSRGLSSLLNRSAINGSYDSNTGFVSKGGSGDLAFQACAKLFVNAVSLTTGYTAAGRGTRKTNSSPITIEPPLLKRFDTDVQLQSSPVMAKGRLFFTSGSTLFCMDANPAGDIDGDGNPDDGLPDAGSGQDLIWHVNLGSQLSSPTYTEVTGNGNVQDMVLVTDANGVVHIFDFTLPTPSRVDIEPPDGEPSKVPSGAKTPNAPTVYQGFAFIGDTKQNDLGRLWVIDLIGSGSPQRLNSGGRDWRVDDATQLKPISAAPTVGCIPIQDNSGGVDLIAYCPSYPTQPTVSDPSATPAGVSSVWFGVRGESPEAITGENSSITVVTRAASRSASIFLPSGGGSSLHSLGLRVTVLHNGVPIDPSTVLTGSVTQSSNGVLNFALTGPLAQDFKDKVYTLRLDYTLDWSRSTSTSPNVQPNAFVRGRLGFPDLTGNDMVRRIHGCVALASNGNFFVVTGPDPDQAGDPDVLKGGSLFAVKEDGRGAFKVLYRWELYDRFTMSVNGSQTGQLEYPPAITEDAALIPPIMGGLFQSPMSRLKFYSGPTVKGDTVYVLAQGGKESVPFGDMMTTLLAFDANPKPVEIVVNNMPSSFALVQPDMARSALKSTPETITSLQPGQYVFDLDSPTTRSGKVRVPNMATITNGNIRDCLTVNLPLIVRQGGQPDIVIEPELMAGNDVFVPGNARGRWNPLKWYTPLYGFKSKAQPVVTGDVIYVGGTSHLVSMIDGTGIQDARAFVYGLDVNISSSDLDSVPGQPWMKYYMQFGMRGGHFFKSKYLMWPQLKDVGSFDDVRTRIRQATLGVDEKALNGLAAGDGVLAVYGDKRLTAFTRADFVIADEGRVGRFDAAGNPRWTTEDTLNGGREVPTSTFLKSIKLSRPSRIYPDRNGNYWIVDVGNSRVVSVDDTGKELRTIAGFRVDPDFQPSGYRANEPRALRMPRDFYTFTTIQQAATNPFKNATGTEMWRHYLIADSANYRLLELVDRYQYDSTYGRITGIVTFQDETGQSQQALGVLLWHSPDELTGKQYSYNSIGVLRMTLGGNTANYYAIGFGNVEPDKSSLGASTTGLGHDISSGYNGIVIFDPTNVVSQVITEYIMPTQTGEHWDEASSSWSSAPVPGGNRKIVGLRSVTVSNVRYGGAVVPGVMFADNTGVYELVQSGSDWVVRWCITNEAYKAMRRRPSDHMPSNDSPKDLVASFARRLDSGDVLIVNGYVGETRSYSPFTGEVVLIRGEEFDPDTQEGYSPAQRNLGFNSWSLQFELPPVSGVRHIVAPVFGDRR